MFILEKGRARAFHSENGTQHNLAFYRDGDFFGELSILNGSPRAASVEAFSDCRLLALEPRSGPRLETPLSGIREADGGTARAIPGENGSARARSISRPRCCRPKSRRTTRLGSTRRLPPRRASRSRAKIRSRRRAACFGKRKKRIRRIEHIEQIDEMDCGAASLGMICRHFGRKVSLSRIRQLCHTSTDGTSLKAICRAATELGLAARALKVSLRNLPLMPLPAIVHWEGNHWMVLYDVTETYVKVADPALGLRKIPRKEFEQNWSGYAALFDYTTALSRTRRRASRGWPGCCRSSTKFRTLFLQVLLLAVAVTFLRTALPDLHRDGGGQGDRRERHRLARNHSARDGRRALLRAGGVAGAGISALLCRRPPRHRDSRFPEPANVVARR